MLISNSPITWPAKLFLFENVFRQTGLDWLKQRDNLSTESTKYNFVQSCGVMVSAKGVELDVRICVKLCVCEVCAFLAVARNTKKGSVGRGRAVSKQRNGHTSLLSTQSFPLFYLLLLKVVSDHRVEDWRSFFPPVLQRCYGGSLIWRTRDCAHRSRNVGFFFFLFGEKGACPKWAERTSLQPLALRARFDHLR